MVPLILVEHFKTSNIPVYHSLPKVLLEKSHEYHKLVVDFIASFSSEDVELFLEGPKSFSALGGTQEERERRARSELAIDLIHREISRSRLLALVSYQGEKPLPYEHPQLHNVAVDKNWLVDFKDFSGGYNALAQGDFIFHQLPSLPQLNSMYWCTMKLCGLMSSADVKVRLDPFMVCQREGYTNMGYKMFVYGVPLDWADIESLQEDRHVRWMPDDHDKSEVAFTDVVWSPRDGEVHFTCEEVPRGECCDVRGGRYFHSIYSLEKNCFIHADGAIRIYSEDEISKRQDGHVRNTGKAGLRVKVFQIDGDVARDEWCSLVAAFYVWNDDVQRYFDPSYQ